MDLDQVTPAFPSDRGPVVMRLKEVMRRTGLSRAKIYALIDLGKFPKQIRLGGSRSVGWLMDEINQWIYECARQR